MADELTAEQHLHREMATLRATEAPMIFFEGIQSMGARNGFVFVTLDAGQHIVVDGANLNNRRVVGHLRFPIAALAGIRQALERMDKQLKEQSKPVPKRAKN